MRRWLVFLSIIGFCGVLFLLVELLANRAYP